MISLRALAHNKFVVFCDAQGKPAAVWTGSMNWTKACFLMPAGQTLSLRRP